VNSDWYVLSGFGTSIRRSHTQRAYLDSVLINLWSCQRTFMNVFLSALS
jgi:hypothetical protein